MQNTTPEHRLALNCLPVNYMKKIKLEKFINESTSISLIKNGLRLQKEINSSLESIGVNLNQALIMLAIFFEPEKTIRSNELSTLIPTTKGNISHCTSFLEEEKLITRQMVAGDLRGFEFSLTTKGHKLSLSLVKFFDAMESRADKNFNSAEQKRFIIMAETI